MVRTIPLSAPADPGITRPSGPPPGPPRLPTRVAARVLATQAALALVVGLTFLTCYAGLQRDPRPLHLPLAVVPTAMAKAPRVSPCARSVTSWRTANMAWARMNEATVAASAT
jgi:hypothetical protein